MDGYGIALRVVSRGKLRVEDGIGRQRRSLVLDRAGSGLERLVLIGHAGFVTLDALAWLRGIGAALVQMAATAGARALGAVRLRRAPIRRAQALAVTNGLDLAIARELMLPSSTGNAGFSFDLAPICASTISCEARSMRPSRSSACA